MRSSESTPSPSPRPAIRSSSSSPGRITRRRAPAVASSTGDSPVRCDASRACVHRRSVLDPHAADPLSAADRALARRGGVLAVDCSWNRLASRGRLPGLAVDDGGIHRRLPILVAGNPQHFGADRRAEHGRGARARRCTSSGSGRRRPVFSKASAGAMGFSRSTASGSTCTRAVAPRGRARSPSASCTVASSAPGRPTGSYVCPSVARCSMSRSRSIRPAPANSGPG